MANEWIIYPRPNPHAYLRLFCFPYAGGGISTFHSWARALPSEFEICPVQLPGRENRFYESPFTELLSLVRTLALIIRPHLDRPFTFFGHSMGATIAFELARLLRKQDGPTPLYLIVSGSRAPQIPDPLPPIHALPEEQLIAELRRLNGTPEAILQHTELLQLILPVLRADLTMHETYKYTTDEPLDCPILAFTGRDDTLVNSKDLIAWREQTKKQLVVHTFSGDHFFLHSSQEVVLRILSQELTKTLTYAKGVSR